MTSGVVGSVIAVVAPAWMHDWTCCGHGFPSTVVRMIGIGRAPITDVTNDAGSTFAGGVHSQKIAFSLALLTLLATSGSAAIGVTFIPILESSSASPRHSPNIPTASSSGMNVDCWGCTSALISCRTESDWARRSAGDTVGLFGIGGSSACSGSGFGWIGCCCCSSSGDFARGALGDDVRRYSVTTAPVSSSGGVTVSVSGTPSDFEAASSIAGVGGVELDLGFSCSSGAWRIDGDDGLTEIVLFARPLLPLEGTAELRSRSHGERGAVSRIAGVRFGNPSLRGSSFLVDVFLSFRSVS